MRRPTTPNTAFSKLMTNKIYALDFDGVICDSAIETGMAGWRVACKLWRDMPESMPSGLISQFRAVRPVLETGYESVLIMRLLFEGISVKTLLEDFHHHTETLITRDQLQVDELKEIFGATRDEWIKQDFIGWIEMNPLFDGFANKLKQICQDNCFIITTKQERFVDHILRANQISFPTDRIYGLDRKLSKPEVLSDLCREWPENDILFVEDRLPTLINVLSYQHLEKLQLYLADWGYNTEKDRQQADDIERIQRLSLTTMAAL
jgi:phosphoglycolate phosphatase-like HAD superfamily hydrolase